MTNREYLNSLSDEELAKALFNLPPLFADEEECKPLPVEYWTGKILKWLQAEREEV